MQGSVVYNLGFAATVCVVCAVFVSSSAVSLRQRQDYNAAIDKQRNVLVVSGVAGDDEELTSEEVERRFANIQQVIINLETGNEVPDGDPLTFDQRRAAKDPATSRAAPPNAAQVIRLPNRALVYEVRDAQGRLQLHVLPVEGLGLWGMLYGFIALDPTIETVQALTFYEHIRGRAGPPDEDPHRVDGLSGATVTSRGVTNLLEFWLGNDGFGPYLNRLRQERVTG